MVIIELWFICMCITVML